MKEGFDGNHPNERFVIIYRSRHDYTNEKRILVKAICVFRDLHRVDATKKLKKFKKRLDEVARMQCKAE